MRRVFMTQPRRPTPLPPPPPRSTPPPPPSAPQESARGRFCPQHPPSAQNTPLRSPREREGLNSTPTPTFSSHHPPLAPNTPSAPQGSARASIRPQRPLSAPSTRL